jgi:predicted RNA-binding Zn ribbon-like protein
MSKAVNRLMEFSRLVDQSRSGSCYGAPIVAAPSPLADAVVPFRLGGHAALDFVNTLDSWSRPATRDYLGSFEKLVRWSREGGFIGAKDADRLLEQPARTRRAAESEALRLRASLERIFGAVIEGASPARDDLEVLNRLLREARGKQELVGSDGIFEWRWSADPVSPSPALRVALAAAELLERNDLERLKRCPAPDGCGWFFLDESRNRSRRWCSMKFCGNVHKARNFSRARKAADLVE